MTGKEGLGWISFLVVALVMFSLHAIAGFSRPQDTSGPLHATQSNHQIYLTWDGFGYNDLYEVQRSTIQGGYYTIIVSGLVEKKYVDTPPRDSSACEPYYYRVRRYDRTSKTDEGFSNEVEVTK